MVQDTEIKLSSYLVTGDYFEGNPDVDLKSLPSKAEYGYVNIHRMASGSLFDGVNSNVQVNRPLLASAVYGENHSMWLVDESALLYGPKNTGDLTYDFRRDTTYEDTFMTKYTTSIRESIDYNALLSLPIKNNEALINKNGPLNRYNSDLENSQISRAVNHVHSWDEGEVIRQASEDVPGIIKYSCLYDSAHFYTVLYTDQEMAELTFDLDGGKLEGFDNELSRQFKVGSTIRLPEAPKKDGYTFQYWSENEYPAGSEYEVKGDRTFKAIWVRSWNYRQDQNSDSEWYNGSRNAPYIRIIREGESEATLSHFRELRLFGTVVKPENYEVEEGSLIIRFKPGYLKYLPAGALKFEVQFDDGSVEFVLNVRNGMPRDDKKEYVVPITGIGK